MVRGEKQLDIYFFYLRRLRLSVFVIKSFSASGFLMCCLKFVTKHIGKTRKVHVPLDFCLTTGELGDASF